MCRVAADNAATQALSTVVASEVHGHAPILASLGPVHLGEAVEAQASADHGHNHVDRIHLARAGQSGCKEKIYGRWGEGGRENGEKCKTRVCA